MKILLLIPLLGFVFSAPVAEEDVEKSPIVKRAMETIMFGNQQNSNKQVKKSDPSIPLREDIPDVKTPVLPDIGGSVQAEEAEDLPELTDSKQTAAAEIEDVNDQETSESKELTSSEQVDEKLASNEGTHISSENQAAIDELTKSVDSGSQEQESTEVQSSNDESLSESQNLDNYDLYELYKEYQKMLSGPSKYNYYMDNYRRRRRGAIQKRRFMGKLKERAVKRAHRSKRDLTYPDESELYDPYYYPELPYSDTDLFGGYGIPYETEEEPLEELLEENNLPYGLGQYEEPSLYDYRPLRYEEEEEPYIPVKRQGGMLSFVPGNRKRSSYFYPVNEEPETHFSAFIPEKRDYFETYGSLVRAARMLAAREEERNALREYEDMY